jgi:methionine-rich copper-binding protein CopC
LTTRVTVIAGAVTAFVALFSGVALAHATYKSSSPADESTVSSAPSQISAEFTEPMTNGSYMAVTDPCGRDSSSGSSQTGSSMSVGNTSSAAGRSSVFWRAASIDGHITEGTFTFTASGGDPCPGEEEEDPGTTTGGGGTGGSGSRSGGSGGSDNGGSASASAGSGTGSANGGHSGRHSGKHAGGGNGDRKNKAAGSEGGADGTSPVADSGREIPEAPSALEGIPVGGLLLTLAVAAFIGAAAGKIYFSLSGDGS